MSEIIASQVPDPQGNVIPASVHDGSMKIVGSQADNQAILVAVDDGVYNVQKATCSPPQCYQCDGETQSAVQASPFGVPVSGSNQLHWTLTWNTGAQYDYTSMSGTNWMSDHTSIATVQTGLVHGVSAGSATMNAYYSGFVPGYAAQICVYGTSPCPVGGSSSGGSSGNVQVPTSIQVLSASILPTGTSGDHGCTPTSDYGIELDIKYQTLDQNGQPLKDATMVPHEHVVVTSGGSASNDNDICPSRISTCSHTTDANGQWHDAPYGACGTPPFVRTWTQNITIILNGTSYPVRTNNITISSSSSGHGSISNGSDINKTR